MSKAIIVDIDGTLANCEHRQHFLKQEKKDWDRFYAGCMNDKVNEWCRGIVNRYSVTANVILVTGRPDSYSLPTLKWLNENDIKYDCIFMRKKGDHRQDCIVKEEIYKRKIEGKYEVIFCIDDRKQVVDMWRRLGLICLQCDEGNF